VAIRSSSAREVEKLVAQLRAGTPVERETAVARLRIIGPRAIDRLIPLLRSGTPTVGRLSALKTLEGMNDARVVDATLPALGDADASVAVAAVAALRAWLSTPDESARVLDAFTSLALDRARPELVRLAALDALAELPRSLVQPVLQRVSGEEAMMAERLRREESTSLDQPGGIREWLALRGASAPLSEIHQLLVTMREQERGEPSAARRQDWVVARGAAHAVLAQRGSRIAMYDLRESFDAAAAPLPLDFLTAVTQVGDASCLEPLARAWSAAATDTWWRSRLKEAARAIVSREKLTRRNAIIKRVRARWPGFLD
jgi:hypothetical protein